MKALTRISVTHWRILAIGAAIVLYAVAVNGHAYEMTAPAQLTYHVAVRKAEALFAFALLGVLFEKGSFPRFRGVLLATIVIGIYSTGIEFGQAIFDHTHETAGQRSFDIASGVFGGALGALIAQGIGARTV